MHVKAHNSRKRGFYQFCLFLREGIPHHRGASNDYHAFV